MKITDRTLKKLSKRLLKVIKEEYDTVDGKLRCAVEKVEIIDVGEYYISYTIGFGRADGGQEFYKQLKIRAGNKKHNLEFLAGQFFQMLLDLDGNQ